MSTLDTETTSRELELHDSTNNLMEQGIQPWKVSACVTDAVPVWESLSSIYNSHIVSEIIV